MRPTPSCGSRPSGPGSHAWNWDGLPYIVKLNFMYLTEVCKEPAERAAIVSRCAGSGITSSAPASRSRRSGGRFNLIDAEFASRNHDVDGFLPLVSPRLNSYLEERLPC
jgi:hypothetical protein